MQKINVFCDNSEKLRLTVRLEGVLSGTPFCAIHMLHIPLLATDMYLLGPPSWIQGGHRVASYQ